MEANNFSTMRFPVLGGTSAAVPAAVRAAVPGEKAGQPNLRLWVCCWRSASQSAVSGVSLTFTLRQDFPLMSATENCIILIWPKGNTLFHSVSGDEFESWAAASMTEMSYLQVSFVSEWSIVRDQALCLKSRLTIFTGRKRRVGSCQSMFSRCYWTPGRATTGQAP